MNGSSGIDSYKMGINGEEANVGTDYRVLSAGDVVETPNVVPLQEAPLGWGCRAV